MKAQAAMEFLLTYGWAVIVVILMISGLAYLGVLDPSEWVPDKCHFSAGLNCGEFIAYDDGSGIKLDVQLTNSFGNSMTIKRAVIEDLESNSGCDCGATTCGLDGLWKAADTKLMTIPCANAVDNVNLRIKLTYKYLDGEYDRLIEGRIQSKVNP